MAVSGDPIPLVRLITPIVPAHVKQNIDKYADAAVLVLNIREEQMVECMHSAVPDDLFDPTWDYRSKDSREGGIFAHRCVSLLAFECVARS